MNPQRVILARPVKVIPPRQSRLEEQRVYDAVTARDKTCRAPIIDPDCDPCQGPAERHHAGNKIGTRKVTSRRRVMLLCHGHNYGAWARVHDREVLAALAIVEDRIAEGLSAYSAWMFFENVRAADEKARHDWEADQREGQE